MVKIMILIKVQIGLGTRGLKYKLFGRYSKLLASLMRNGFPRRPSGASLQNLLLFYDVPFGFVTKLPRTSVLIYLRPSKCGCYSTSDESRLYFVDRTHLGMNLFWPPVWIHVCFYLLLCMWGGGGGSRFNINLFK